MTYLPEAALVVPCARCGQPSSSDVWGLASCADCRALWMASERTTSRHVDMTLGVVWERGVAILAGQVLTSEQYHAATCEEFRRLARVWSHSAKRAQASAGAA